MWHDDIESVGGTPLEEHDQAFLAGDRFRRSVDCARQKARNRSGAD
jgi:hypothetical protein